MHHLPTFIKKTSHAIKHAQYETKHTEYQKQYATHCRTTCSTTLQRHIQGVNFASGRSKFLLRRSARFAFYVDLVRKLSQRQVTGFLARQSVQWNWSDAPYSDCIYLYIPGYSDCIVVFGLQIKVK